MNISEITSRYQTFEFYKSSPVTSEARICLINESTKRMMTAETAITSLPIDVILDFRSRFQKEEKTRQITKEENQTVAAIQSPAIQALIKNKNRLSAPVSKKVIYITRVPANKSAPLPQTPSVDEEPRRSNAKRKKTKHDMESLPPLKRSKFDQNLDALIKAAEGERV